MWRVLCARQRRDNMRSEIKRKRPKNLDLRTIRLPINALVSILHRVSGVILFLSLPLGIGLLQMSLTSEVAFTKLVKYFNFPVVKLGLTILFLPLIHHLYAGIRHLGQDVHWMTSLQKAKFSGKVVLWLDVMTMLIVIWKIW